jgi:PAS domain S-box-containing protein
MIETNPQEQITLLVEAYGQMLSTLSPHDLFPAILELSARFLTVDAYAVWSLDPSDNAWKIVANKNLSDSYLQIPISAENQTIIIEKTMVVADVLNTTVPGIAARHESYRAENIRSMMVVPLWMHGKFSGTIAFYHRSPYQFDERVIRLATAFGNLASSALSVSNLYTAEQKARASAEAAEHAVQEELQKKQQIQEELRRREERFRALLDKAMDIISIINLEGRMQYISPSITRVLGYEENDLMNQIAFDYVHPDDLQSILQAFGAIVEQPGTLQSATYRFKHRDGSWRYLETRARTLFEDGEVNSIVANSRDVTERAEAEQAIYTHQAAIEALNERLKRAMVETHHRVKNNLQIISAMLDMRLMECTDSVPVEDIRRLTSHIRTLAEVHNLLTHEAKSDAVAETISSKEMLERLLPLMREAAGRRQITAHLEPAELSLRKGTSLALITNELVSNAAKYGGGEIGVRFVVEGEEGILTVCDDGPGFDEGFDPATEANTGLELVESLGRWDLNGTVHYGNRPQGGACVTVKMPL